MSAEPSMEDILASIKRIIAEDADSGTPLRARRRAPPRAVDADEVLELSETAPRPVHFQPEPAAPPPMPMSPPVADVPLPVGAAAPDASAPEPAVAAPVAETIVSDQTAQASRAKLDTLSKLVDRPEPPSSVTLEGLVRDMLKPMLRDWLDSNLPPMVESMVAREIARITGGR